MARGVLRTDAGTTTPSGPGWSAKVWSEGVSRPCSSRRLPGAVERGGHRGGEIEHLDLQLIERQFDSARPGSDQPESRSEVVLPHDHAQPATQPVPFHRRADGSSNGERDVAPLEIVLLEIGTPQGLPSKADAVTTEADEDVTISNRIDQADSRVRPLARRAFSTARPPRVLMRARKPCVLARRRAFG